MNRRSILGMVGLGSIAGPAVAKEMIYPTEPSNALGFIPTTSGIGWNPVEQLDKAKKDYDFMLGDKARWIADTIANEYREHLDGYGVVRLETIDPDIRNMKSLSESTKVRMYIERKAKRRYESSKNNMFTHIQELMKDV